MGRITGQQGQAGMHKPPVRTELREVKVVSVIRTMNCVGAGIDGDPVRLVQQYWTEEGEQITSEPTRFDHFVWLETWKNAYEDQVCDGKAKEFLDWIIQQPMSAG